MLPRHWRGAGREEGSPIAMPAQSSPHRLSVMPRCQWHQPHSTALWHGEAAARRTLPEEAGSCPSPFIPQSGTEGKTDASTLLVPGSMSSKLERASGWRSSDFGVNIISWRREEEAEQGSQPHQKHLPCKQRLEDRPAPPACPPLPEHGSSCKKFVPRSAAMLCQIGHRFPTAPAFPVWISPGEWAEVLPGTCLPHGWN